MPEQRARRYSIEIQDDQDKTVIFTAADWTNDERREAVARVLRWAGLPDAGCFNGSPPQASL